MIRRNIFATTLLVIAISVFSSGIVNAQSGGGAPFFQMFLGNYWEYNGRQDPPPDTWTWREQVVAEDNMTIPGITTYRVEGLGNGTVEEKKWYSISHTEMRWWRVEFLDEGEWNIVILTNGIRVAKNPLTVGDSWTDTTPGTFNGNPISVTSQSNVESYADITVPLGTYKAYQIHRVITIPELGGVVEDVNFWVVPYIGIIKQEFIDGTDKGIEELFEMGIRKVIIDFDKDAKTDISIYRRTSGGWFVLPSTGASPYGVGWGGDDYVKEHVNSPPMGAS